MLKLLFICRCGYSRSVPYEPFKGLLRDELLPRARCSRCGRRGAVDLRIYWDAGGHCNNRHELDKPKT